MTDLVPGSSVLWVRMPISAEALVKVINTMNTEFGDDLMYRHLTNEDGVGWAEIYTPGRIGDDPKPLP